ncbi:MAG: hypothetical protein H8E66_23980 [Planctomycetes bacterium]|nr:hypothetical protein [Planctomycetota bacterium]
MKELELSFNSRKALSVHIGEAAAAEIIDFLEKMADRVEKLERGKVDVLQIVPTTLTKAKTPPMRKAA